VTDLQTRIADAIIDLAAELIEGANVQALIADIASEYGVKAEALIARFEKQHGHAPSEHAAYNAQRAQEVESANILHAQAEAKQAERIAAESAAIKEWFAANPNAFAGTRIRRIVESPNTVITL